MGAQRTWWSVTPSNRTMHTPYDLIRLVVQKCQGSACAALKQESHSVKVIHPHIRPVGSYGSAEVPTWSTTDMYDWAKPIRSPIFAYFMELI